MELGLLSADEAAAYWENRHQAEDDLRSGGHIGFDHVTNEIFYASRLGKLLEIIGDQTSLTEPLFVLDAGCGKGWFSRAVHRCGHRVDAIDTSESALTYCQEMGDGPRYLRSALSTWSSPWLYDVVFSIDVLFHILDDTEWESSVCNLASLVRLGGRLIFTDWGEVGQRAYGNYQVLRGCAHYLPLMKRCGFRFDDWQSYNFRMNPIGFYIFTRTN